MKDFLAEYRVLLTYPQNIIILLARFAVAYGFALPALMKIQNLESTTIWFDSIGIPFASFAAYMVSAVETAGIVLLILGLFTRYISVLLAFVMIGAMLFVHMEHGYAVANNGAEIVIYYFLFLCIFATFGPGKFSLDQILFDSGNYE
jgi:putative oxidoreductase